MSRLYFVCNRLGLPNKPESAWIV